MEHLRPTNLPSGIRLIEVVGRGGSAVVWRARDRRSGRDVAVKVIGLPPDGPPRERTRDRFERELRALARLRHDHVLAVSAAGTDRDCCWVLTPLADDSLAGRTDRAPITDPAELCELALAVGPALLLSAGHLRRTGLPAAFRPVREALLATAAIVVVALALPLGFGVQFLNSLGALLLLLAATALPARALPIAVLALCPTSLWFFSLLSGTRPDSWPGPETRAALAFLERDCTPRDRLLAPDELSAYAAGLTACRVVSGHWVLTPEAPRRWAEVAAFYAPQADPAARAAALAAWRPSLVLAPPGAGALPGHSLAWRQGGLEIWRRGP